jgi:mevalonate kinase
MSRKLEEVQKEYSEACVKLGQEIYLQHLHEEELKKREYTIEKLLNQIKSLNAEGHKLVNAGAPTPDAAKVSLPEVVNE